ncbi:MAG: CD3324 family protein [Lachnospiraceae bacterium]
MSYRKAEEILPRELIEVIQQYVDGENIYIPRKLEHRKGWGERTQARQELMRATVPFAGSIERAKVSRDYPRNIILQKRVYSGLSASIDNNKNEGCRKVAPIF